MVSAAVPLLRVAVPSTVGAPFKTSTNWTVPVAVLGETVAVKVTACPAVAGLMFAESNVELGA
jgi:hypothetical protein